MSVEYTVHHGGLMRCCLATLNKAMLAATEPPKEGDKLQCEYHDGYGMIFRNGAWEWAAPPMEFEDAPKP